MLSEMTVACDKSLHAATVTSPYMRTAVHERAEAATAAVIHDLQKIGDESVLFLYHMVLAVKLLSR